MTNYSNCGIVLIEREWIIKKRINKKDVIKTMNSEVLKRKRLSDRRQEDEKEYNQRDIAWLDKKPKTYKNYVI